jgi:hypothetical protein
LFLRLLGVIWFVAFASLGGQIVGLVGERGIMPAGHFLEWAGSIYGSAAWWQLPTVFWVGVGDGALRAVAWMGAALGLLLAASPVALYPSYAAERESGALSPLEDQALGGVVMWAVGGAVDTLGVILLLYQFFASDAAR